MRTWCEERTDLLSSLSRSVIDGRSSGSPGGGDDLGRVDLGELRESIRVMVRRRGKRRRRERSRRERREEGEKGVSEVKGKGR